MKIRNGFVSNSSSSSFTISLNKLSDDQLELIYDHIQQAKDRVLNLDADEWDAWAIEKEENELKLSTWMDNFDMHWYLTNIVKVQEEDIR